MDERIEGQRSNEEVGLDLNLDKSVCQQYSKANGLRAKHKQMQAKKWECRRHCSPKRS